MELNNRELATLFWLAVFFGTAFSKGTVRRSFRRLGSAFCQPKILLALGVAAAWILLSVMALNQVGLWHAGNLRTTGVWAVTFAFLTMFEVDRIREDSTYLARSIRDLVGATAAVTFVAEMYTFGLIVELVLVPCLALLTMMQVVAKAKVEHAAVERLAGSLLVVTGGVYVVYGAYRAVADLDSVASVATLQEFLMPAVLSLCYLPFIYGFAVYCTYESYFSRFDFFLEDDSYRKLVKRRVMLAFGPDLDVLQRWWREFLRTRPANEQELERSIRAVRLRRKRERNPPSIDPAEGWSPYWAADLLAELGLGTGEYHPDIGDNAWYASSPMIELGDELFPDNLAYYVEGDEWAAKRLKLKLNVNNPGDAGHSEERLWQAAARLVWTVVDAGEADEIAAALWDAQACDRTAGSCRVRAWREDFTGRIDGYSRIVVIEHIRRLPNTAEAICACSAEH